MILKPLTSFSSSLPKGSLDVRESELYPFITPELVSSYLFCRNSIIKQWHEEYSDRLMSLEQVEESTRSTNPMLCEKAFLFLDRYRLINYGYITLNQLSITTDKTLVIVGAGLVGLTITREIYNMYHSRKLAMPRIMVVEGRQRIGGRIFTFPLHFRWSTEEQSSAIELGTTRIAGIHLTHFR